MLVIILLLNNRKGVSLQGIIQFLKTKIAPIKSNIADYI